MPAAPSPDSRMSAYLPVHALRPADIQVVAALGDSLTVRTLEPLGVGVGVVWRGGKWAMGVVGPIQVPPS